MTLRQSHLVYDGACGTESENVPFQSGDLRGNPLRRHSCNQISCNNRNVIRLLYSDGIKRYSVGILVFMVGVITPFT